MKSTQRAFQTFFPFLIIVMNFSTGHAAEGLQWERLRLLPELSMSETFTDNVYLTSSDVRGDAITTVSPKASLDFALAPQHYLSARYTGYFRFFERSDNFKEYIYLTGLSWSLTESQGSTFKVDASADHNSIQPYSALDTHRDYVLRDVFADTVLKSVKFAEIGLRYDHSTRTFADDLYAADDYKMDTITLDLTYWKLPVTGFLVEYIYSHQNNYNLPSSQTLDTQVILAGVRWDPTAKLSGHLKAGHYSTRLGEGEKSGGFDMDADLAYKMSDFTRISLTAFRYVVRSTIAARETGEFYISTGGTIAASYNRWGPITMTADVAYINNKFTQTGVLAGGERIDDFSATGLGAKYSPKDWLSFTLNYKYKVNDSNYAAYGYRENRIEARLSFAI